MTGKFVIPAALAILFAVGAVNANVNKIDPSILNLNSPVDVLISFGPIPKSIYSPKQNFLSRADKISSLTQSLQDHSSSSQIGVTAFLNSNSVKFTQLWITNQIFVKRCSQQLIHSLAEFPEVTFVGEDFHITMVDDRIPGPQIVGKSDLLNEWGVSVIQAPEALSLLKQQNWNEIRIGVVDTGIRATHETLRNAYIGTYGWFDPMGNTQTPTDDNGHGTHVAGSIAGSLGTGVFPDAKILACKGCGATCPSSSLTACGQFTICPTLPDGTNANCSYAAHVAQNSWNGGQGQTWFRPVVDAWESAGIIPVFSAGNTGNACGTLQSPADNVKVISVGASSNVEDVAYFSSAGPSVFGDIKPDVVAPGHQVRSAWASSDFAYAVASGTSMACPHVSAVVGILLSYKPDLTFDEVKNFLTSGADRDAIGESGRNCGGVKENVYPNNNVGWGRINALQSLEALINSNQPEPTTTTEATTTTEEPLPTTEEVTDLPTSTTESPAPGGCFHGPFWFPDEVNVPNLICVCQSNGCSSELSYNCLTAAGSR